MLIRLGDRTTILSIGSDHAAGYCSLQERVNALLFSPSTQIELPILKAGFKIFSGGQNCHSITLMVKLRGVDHLQSVKPSRNHYRTPPLL